MIEDSEVRQNKRKDKLKEITDQDNNATKAVMATKEGRRLVYRILESSRLDQLSFTGNSETFFREGQRAVGLRLYNELIQQCPESYWAMQTENRKKEATNG